MSPKLVRHLAVGFGVTFNRKQIPLQQRAQFMKRFLQLALVVAMSGVVSTTGTHTVVDGAGAGWNPSVEAAETDRPASAARVAAAVDQAINGELKKAKVEPAKLANDEDFFRRVSIDLGGAVPTAREVTLFGLNTDSAKRAKVIDQLLNSDEHAASWSRYWRDVILLRATNMRAPLVNNAFLDWMRTSLKQNKSWDKIATELITATGEVREDGRTALYFAHEGDPNEVAGEVGRIFMGIQLQCANCHNHPWDRWKREQFHEIAAFFPRVTVRRTDPNNLGSWEVVSYDARTDRENIRNSLMANAEAIFRFNDRNGDGKLSREEATNSAIGRLFDRVLENGDKNKDGLISLAEFREMPPPPEQPGRGKNEHFMPDLNNPAAQGTKINPKFFFTSSLSINNLDDLERRKWFAEELTSPKNEWFSKAIVNRLWGELLGQGFYMPIDDLGPDRKPVHPEALDILSTEFAQHGYDLKWLFRTITLTQAYQRQVQPRDLSEDAPVFAAATPTRLRADQLFSSVLKVLGVPEPVAQGPRPGQGGANRFAARTPRDAFSLVFGFDPSTPQDDITGNVPQALFFMNSPQITSQIRADGNTRLADLLRKYPDNKDAINELYLMVLAREATAKEVTICTAYIAQVGQRGEAFEDLLWSLLNSSEFLSKR